ncbi:sensor histidine kinase [Kineococcus sp. SYSU DK003]|uniref:sensor histidine kinase n=1 Tax=Kineococcus sp. SYSU DK003 TaxID=3383124 RepID=UPI003D7F0FE8
MRARPEVSRFWGRPRPGTGAVTRRLQALAVVLFVLCALGLSVSVVDDVLTGELGWARTGARYSVPFALTATVVSASAAVAVTLVVLGRTLGRRAERPRAAALVALALVAYVPALLLGPGWIAWSAVLGCFALELLPAAAATVVYLAGLLAQLGVSRAVGEAWGDTVFAGISYVATSVLLFLVVRSVNTYRELELARAELAHAEVLAERVRVSRDLHDLLGRNLAAISLKVELARRHHRSGKGEAVRSELDEVLALSHAAAADLRVLVAGYRALSLRSELAAAVRLLTDAGVRCEADADPGLQAGAADEVVAWVLREAATNVVKHAHATRCRIAVHVRQEPAAVQLVVENDGVHDGDEASGSPFPLGAGSGLLGMRERVQALGGSVWSSAGGGTFRLSCSVPLSKVSAVEGKS